MRIDYENKLNREQLEAVKKGDGYALVLSGPGSGKTRVLTFRVAYLLEKGVSPENILLLTFTKKAASEMISRIEELVGGSAFNVLGGTFHHVGNYYLRKYASELGYGEDYTILDQEDSKDLLEVILGEMGDDDLPNAKTAQRIISLAVNSDQPVKDVAFDNLSTKSPEKIEEVKKRYDERKKSANLMDYDDLLTNWLKLLEGSSGKDISERFQYVLVDEYQDTNVIQDRILQKASSIHKNLMVVGDDSQSIYSFRAAEIKNILSFSDKYPAKVFRLETNYRSTPEILNLANCIIKYNSSKLNKTLKSVQEEGVDPIVSCLSTPREQSRFIVRKISDLDYGDSAVLFRAHYQAAGLELELAKEGIPYIVRGGTRFFEQAHVKDISAFLKLMVNIKDEPSWLRVLKKQDGVGDAYARRATAKIIQCNSPDDLITEEENIISDLPSRVIPKVKEIIEMMRIVSNEENVTDGLKNLIERWYKDKLDDFDNPRERMDDLKQLVELSAEYESLGEMLSDFALSEDFQIESDRRALTLSTIHQAKGLEWQNVFIISLKEGAFPHKKSLEENMIEEERRLFYVAVTRCKKNLFLTYPVFERGGASGPSRFLREIEDYLAEDSPIEEEIELIDEDDFDFF